VRQTELAVWHSLLHVLHTEGLMVIGSLFLLLAVYVAYLKAFDGADKKKQFDLLYGIFVLGLFVAGLWLTRLSPFFGLVGVVIVALTLTKFVPKSKETFLRYVGFTVFLAALIVLGTKQFLRASIITRAGGAIASF
jgi:hypothetical protein